MENVCLKHNNFFFPPLNQAGSFKKWLTFVDVWIGGESIYQRARCGRPPGSLKSRGASLPFDWLISQSEDIFHWAAECFISANAGASEPGPAGASSALSACASGRAEGQGR